MDLYTTPDEPMELVECQLFLKGQDNSKQVRFGERGACRFCGETDRAKFRKTAHTVPRSIGNSRLVSLDECDRCNELFGYYDDQLVRFFGSYLTMVGLVSGKKPPKTKGRSSSIQRKGDSISVRASVTEGGFFEAVMPVMTATGPGLRFTLPESYYIPAYVYLALSKQAIALMPADALKDFRRLTEALLAQGFNHSEEFPENRCVVSLMRATSTHPVALTALLYRRNDKRRELNLIWPRWIYALQVNDVMLMVPLMSDDWWSRQRESYGSFNMNVALRPPPMSGLDDSSAIGFAPSETMIMSGTEAVLSPFFELTVQTGRA